MFKKNTPNTAELEQKIVETQKELEEKLEELKNSHLEKIESIKYDLTREILSQSNEPINRVIKLLTVMSAISVAGIGLLTLFIGNNLSSALESQMRQRIESWLSLDTETSIASKTLDEYRTRALLDSYMIQLAREKARGRQLPTLTFKKGDEKRLLSIIESTNSEAADFYDALKLLSTARGIWGLPFANNDTAERLRKIFQRTDFDPTRKFDILQAFERDQALVEVAIDLIKNPDTHPTVRHQAFLMLKNHNINSSAGQLAFQYALSTISARENFNHTNSAAEYLATISPFHAALDNYIEYIKTLSHEEQMAANVKLAASWIQNLPSPNLDIQNDTLGAEKHAREKIRQRVSLALSAAIDAGLQLVVTEDFTSKPHLALQYHHTSGTRESFLEFPIDKLLEDELLINNLVELQKKNPNKIVNFFNITYNNETISTLRGEIPSHALGNTKNPIPNKLLAGALRNSKEGRTIFVWKDENMEQKEYILKNPSILQKIFVRYDKSFIKYENLDSFSWML